MKRRRTWTSLTAAAAAVPVAMTGTIDLAPTLEFFQSGVTAGKTTSSTYIALSTAWAAEGGEGGEGGEAGVDVNRAAEDPVTYLTALDVIAAHYHAGLAAFLAGDKEQGGMMFAHPISEVYVDMKPTFAKLGVADFEPLMQASIEKATSGAPADEVRLATAKVFEALQAAAAKAPKAKDAGGTVEAKVFLDMLNRAALQLAAAYKPDGGDAYLDGFGYFTAAKARAPKALAAFTPNAAEAAQAALDQAATAYPSITQPEVPLLDPGQLMAAVSKVLLAAGPN